MATFKFHVGLTKNYLFSDNFVVFPVFFIKLQRFTNLNINFHKRSGFFVTCTCNFCYFLTFFKSKCGEIEDGRSKMVGQLMTSLPTSCRTSSGLSNQCKLILLCLKRTRTKGGVPSTFLVPWWGYGTHSATDF